MGQLRTINHPGIEHFEHDATGATEQVGGCTSLVVGFFPQGEAGTVVNPTTLKSLKAYHGLPETEAERYAYYAAKNVFDNGGRLLTARIPYDNNSQYLTPAVKFNIEEWSTAHIKEFSPSQSVRKYAYIEECIYSNVEESDKSKFFAEKHPKIESLTIADKRKNGSEIKKAVTVINTDEITGTSNGYYTIAFNAPFIASKTATIGEEEYEVEAYVGGDFEESGEDTYSKIYFTVEVKGYASKFDGSYFTENESSFVHENIMIKAVQNELNHLTGEFEIYVKDEENEFTVKVVSFNKSDLIYQAGWELEGDVCKTTITEGTKLNPSLFSSIHADSFSIRFVQFDKWADGNAVVDTEASTEGFYSEELVADKTTFFYSKTRSQPTTGFVDKLTETGSEQVMAIETYYKSGVGVKHADMSSDKFLELRVWDTTRIQTLEDLTEENAQCFDIITQTYEGAVSEEKSKISDSSFKSVAVTADVTTGFESSDISSELLAIHPADNWDEAKDTEPEFVEVENPFGKGYIAVLSKLNSGVEVAFNPNDFYEFVSPYASIRDVALAKSENYHWIRHTVNTTLEETGVYKNNIMLASVLGCETDKVPEALSKIENLVTISPDVDNLGYISLSDYLDYRDDAKKVEANTIVIANITEQKFEKDSFNNTHDEVADGEEVLGIVPVLMTGFQALPKQSRVEIPGTATNSKIFNALETIIRGSSMEVPPAGMKEPVTVKSIELNQNGYVRELGNTGKYDPYESTYSNTTLARVPSIDLNSAYKPNGTKTNCVTVAVCKLSLSSVNDNKVALTVLESFTGSLDASAKDDAGNSIFIDNVVNSDESGSAYIKFFSNYETTLKGEYSRTATEEKVIKPASVDTKVTVVTPASCGVTGWWGEDKRMQSLGFTEEQSKKYISYATLVATIENVFDMLSNVDEEDIDIVVDAGLTSIANRINKYVTEHPDETKTVYDLTFDKINSVTDVAGWKSMAAKLLTFCQTTRKDCMALIDAPRSLCVKNNAKLIDCKKNASEKYSVDYDILPKFNYLGGLNSSYGAGFCNWVLAVDDFSGKNFWVPPSIAAEGNIIYTDYNSNYWMAPAGEKRGTIPWAVDVAFNPNGAQQDSIYSKSWNYAISSGGNIMTWGQKTFLTSNSSFNRINVRRLFLRLERLVRKNSKWVVFELNNLRTRNKYLDRIDPIFANVKAMGGLYDYQLIVDNRNNSGDVIDANEFRFAALLKPSKVAEFVILDFFNLNTNADFSEVYGDL